jgi:hypothetical protein
MPTYRIHRMKDAPRQQFRYAPHVSGCANVKPKDYEPAGEVEAANEYDAWKTLSSSDRPLAVGDLLEASSGQLSICKYVGIEPAQWVLPEPKPPRVPSPGEQQEGATAAAGEEPAPAR